MPVLPKGRGQHPCGWFGTRRWTIRPLGNGGRKAITGIRQAPPRLTFTRAPVSSVAHRTTRLAALVQLEFLAFSGLPSQQKRFGILSLTAELEGAEVLVLQPFGRFRLGLAPELQLVEVLCGDLAFSEAVKQVLAKGGGQASH